MRVDILAPAQQPPVPRAYVLTMVILSFKGRRDVEVHLFRPAVDPAEAADWPWERLLGDPLEPGRDDPAGSRRLLLEAFTADERNAVVDYLKARYGDRVSMITGQALDFPIPLGLRPLSDIPEGKTVGFIRFDQVPNYPLSFPVHGFYDLARHKPLVDEG